MHWNGWLTSDRWVPSARASIRTIVCGGLSESVSGIARIEVSRTTDILVILQAVRSFAQGLNRCSWVAEVRSRAVEMVSRLSRRGHGLADELGRLSGDGHVLMLLTRELGERPLKCSFALELLYHVLLLLVARSEIGVALVGQLLPGR